MEAVAAGDLEFGLSASIIAMLRDTFAQFPGIATVLLYGSRARGTFRSYSDIDLAVQAPQMSDAEFSQLWCAIDDLPIIFKFDVLHLERLSNAALRKNILAEGVPLYVAAPR